MFSSQAAQSLYRNYQGTWASSVLDTMTLREKIAQMFFVAVSHVAEGNEILASQLVQFPHMHRAYVEELIKTHQVGGIIFLRKSSLNEQMVITQHYQQLSKHPLLVVEDLEWGLQMRINDTIKFPYNMTLGAIRDESLVYELGKEIGRQCKVIGVQMNLAPVVDVNSNGKNPVIGYRSFGEEKEIVARLGTLMIQGFHDAGILACAKHFPGHGDTDVDSHLVIPVIRHDRERLNDLELYPFKRIIAAGVDAIMNAHLMVPALDEKNISTVSYRIIQKLLKEKLGFDGLVITDALNMGAVKDLEVGELELKAFMAGNDILLCPMDVPKAIDCIERAVQEGVITEQDINERVLKILRAKEFMNLHENRTVSIEGAQAAVRTDYAFALKKKLYQEAITLVQNNHGILPLKNYTGLRVIQICANNQSGHSFVETLLSLQSSSASCVVDYVPVNATKTQVDECIRNLADVETVLVSVFDMQRLASKNFGISEGTLLLLAALKQHNKKIILVVFGSPYALKLFGNEDAIVVAYEDDPDAQQAAAEAIMGILPMKGKLPITASEKFVCGLSMQA